MVAICPCCGQKIKRPFQASDIDADLLKRFWKAVKKDASGCWLSSSSPTHTYSRYGAKGQAVLGHVLSWIIHNGDIPAGKIVCHRCDVPKCVNPEHLFLGTPQQNAKDKILKGRANPPKGEQNNNAKLTESEVISIRQALADQSCTIEEVAQRYGTSFQSIYQMAIGNTWKHVGGPRISLKPKRTLTVEEVKDIRFRARMGEKQITIANSYGIHQATISNIVHGSKRADVPMV